MKPTIFVLIGILVLVGVLTNFRARLTGYDRPDEAWVKARVPSEAVMGYQPVQTYKMDETTYEELKPFGIISQIYANNDNVIDTVVIASDDSDSFHDQQWCFQGQGWTFTKIEERTMKTEKFGEIPVKAIRMVHEENGEAVALFTFKGPDKTFYSSFDKMWWDFISREFKSGTPQKGSFYRFISSSWEILNDPAKLDEFAATFIDETDTKSEGQV